MYSLTNGQIPLIGVGGISNGAEFYEKINNKNLDKPDKVKDHLFKNMVYRSSERNVLLFNHPEFLKA